MSLPSLCVSFLERSAFGDDPVKRVWIEQKGEMRMKPGGSWLPFDAEQWFDVERTAFCWKARVKMAPLTTAIVEDALENGHGRLDAKLWGVIRVAHGRGPDVDRGELQRYLAELPWNPLAVRRNNALVVEEQGPRTTRVWTGSPEAYVDLAFDEAGDIATASCDNRPRGDAGPTPWQGRFMDYGELGGLRVPRAAEVEWTLPEGPFVYWRGTVTKIKLEK